MWTTVKSRQRGGTARPLTRRRPAPEVPSRRAAHFGGAAFAKTAAAEAFVRAQFRTLERRHEIGYSQPVTQSADDLYRAAMRLHQQGQAAEAGRLYDAVLAQEPRHYGALHLKGVLRLQAGDYAGAVELITRSLAIEPDHGLALANLGVAYRSMGRLDEAVTVLRRALSFDPNSPLVLANLGQALNRSGNIAESVIYNRQALALNPKQLGLQSSVLFAEPTPRMKISTLPSWFVMLRPGTAAWSWRSSTMPS